MKMCKLLKDYEKGSNLCEFCKKGMVLRGVIDGHDLAVETKDLIELNRDILNETEITSIKITDSIMKNLLGRNLWYFGLEHLEEIKEKE